MQQATFPVLATLDLGCAPMVRLGIAPYSDWGQERDIETTPATASAWPTAYTTRVGIGDSVGDCLHPLLPPINSGNFRQLSSVHPLFTRYSANVYCPGSIMSPSVDPSTVNPLSINR